MTGPELTSYDRYIPGLPKMVQIRCCQRKKIVQTLWIRLLKRKWIMPLQETWLT